jgi:hypothetical protein
MDEDMLTGGAPHPFPKEYLAEITSVMEAKLNENRREKAVKAALKRGLSRADAEASNFERVRLSGDRKTILMSNGAEAGYAFADRNGVRHATLKWTTVHGAPQEQFAPIRAAAKASLERTQGKKGTKPLSMGSAKAAFTRYWKNRDFKNPRSRQAAMQNDLNNAAKDEDIVTTQRYLRNPAKFDYKGFDDSTGPRSHHYDAKRDPQSKQYVPGSKPLELHRRKAHSRPNTKEQLANRWRVAEFQEGVDAEGRPIMVRHRVDGQGNKLARSPQNKRSQRAARQSIRRPGQSQAAYDAELEAKNAAAKAKRASVRAAKPAKPAKAPKAPKAPKAMKGGNNEESESEEEEDRQQGGGRAVSLKTAVRLLRSYYNNKYNRN